MSIQSCFKDQKAFVGYLTAGDGGIEKTLSAMKALVAGGVDILEVGVPFSDPVADGPVIQSAAKRALEAGVTMQDILVMIARFKQTHTTPVILFTYFNPLLQQGDLTAFLQHAKSSGVDACLVVDLPLEESATYLSACDAAEIDPILLLSPSTPFYRLQQIAMHGKGMLYYACRKGVTGVQSGLPSDLVEKMRQIKNVTRLPVVVGFGIGDALMAEEVLTIADGFVVGSRFVSAAHDSAHPRGALRLSGSDRPSHPMLRLIQYKSIRYRFNFKKYLNMLKKI